MNYYVYVLRSRRDGLFYTCCTSNLVVRLAQHNRGKVFATRERRPFILTYVEVSSNAKDAYAREKYLKSGMGKRYIRNRLKHQLGNSEL